MTAKDNNCNGPLSGIRVADFSVHAAGPFAGLMLAEMGAQVIKIESSARLDITRRTHTMYGKPPSSFEQINANKMSACLNLKEPQAIELALKLVSVSDLVLENFRPGVMDRLGIGYPSLINVKPDIILVSLSSNGQTGPESNYAGYAPMFAALGGLGHLTGYPDGPPVELRHGMDHTGGMLAAFASVAGLCAKANFSLGQHIDVSIRDMGASFIGPALLDYAMNQKNRTRIGNRDESSAPQGVYRCLGEDNWIAISVSSDDEWRCMVQAMGYPDWATKSRFGDGFKRWKNHDELDLLIEKWTSSIEASRVSDDLQHLGVAASVSLSPKQVFANNHLVEREAFTIVSDQEKGQQKAVSPPWKFSKTIATIDKWTPELGENNREVFNGILGLEISEIENLERHQVIW